MAANFDGWSAHDIVGPLNRKEIRTALLDYEIEKKNFKTWDAIERMILNSSEEVKFVLFRCGEAKKNVEEQHRLTTLKRRRENRMTIRNVRRRLGMCVGD
jgi:hypothetical protein